MALTGREDGPPTPIGTFAIDYLAAMQFAQGMMLALAAREKTGRGQVVDACLLNAAVALHLQEGTTYLNTGREFPRAPRSVAHIHNTALYAQYTCGDGRSLVIIAEFYISEPWRRVCRALGLSQGVIDDVRFHSVDGLLANIGESYDILAAGFVALSRDEAMRRLEAEGVLVAPVK